MWDIHFYALHRDVACIEEIKKLQLETPEDMWAFWRRWHKWGWRGGIILKIHLEGRRFRA